ncbi:hypothetical protein H4S06_002460, partial [Coemansia sp. BCRC 34490]
RGSVVCVQYRAVAAVGDCAAGPQCAAHVHILPLPCQRLPRFQPARTLLGAACCQRIQPLARPRPHGGQRHKVLHV